MSDNTKNNNVNTRYDASALDEAALTRELNSFFNALQQGKKIEGPFDGIESPFNKIEICTIQPTKEAEFSEQFEVSSSQPQKNENVDTSNIAVQYPLAENVKLSITLDQWTGDNLWRASVEENLTPSALVTRELMKALEKEDKSIFHGLSQNVTSIGYGISVLNVLDRKDQERDSKNGKYIGPRTNEKSCTQEFQLELPPLILNLLESALPEKYIENIIEKQYEDLCDNSFSGDEFNL